MKPHRPAIWLAMVAVLGLPGAARAGLLGDQIAGEVYFPDLMPDLNLFDPANGLVPDSGVNPEQPRATVSDDDTDFVEFHMYSPSSTNGLYVDVDDMEILVQWTTRANDIAWYPHEIRITGLDFDGSGRLTSVIETRNDVSARVTWDDHAVAIFVPLGGALTSRDITNVLRLRLARSVSHTGTSWSRIKSLYER